MENPTCTAFKEYKDMPETVLLELTEDDVTWAVSKLSSTAGVLGSRQLS